MAVIVFFAVASGVTKMFNNSNYTNGILNIIIHTVSILGPIWPGRLVKIAKEFHHKWNYPCCLGALDGKNIAIQQPEDSGSEFFNYKHYILVLFS